MNEIYGLHFDFVGGNGAHLLIAPHALRRLSIVPHQVHMLTRNRIPGLLPFACEDWNGSHRLLYDIAGKRNLVRTLRSLSPDETVLFEIAYRLVRIVADSAGYLINETNYLLHEDFVYFEAKPTEPLLGYLPLDGIDKPSLAAELRLLLLRLFSCANRLDGDRVPRLLAALLADRLATDDLKRLLKEFWIRPVSAGTGGRRAPENTAVKRVSGGASRYALLRKTVSALAHIPEQMRRLPARKRKNARKRMEIASASGHASAETERNNSGMGKTQILSGTTGASAERQRCRLHIRKPDHEEIVEVSEDRFLVGRSRSGVNYTDASEGVSRIHCEFARSENGWVVKDLGSLNGTALNGEPLIPFKTYPFGTGDRLEFARTEIRLVE